MAKKETSDSAVAPGAVLREPAEIRHADQLEALRQNDGDTPPPAWKLSRRSVFTYIVGGKALKAKIDGKTVETPVTRKFFGEDSPGERAHVPVASAQALVLIGAPGTGQAPVG